MNSRGPASSSAPQELEFAPAVAPTRRTSVSRRSLLLGVGASALSAGSLRASAADVPSTSRFVPRVGKSGLPWNSLVFGHGTNPAAFETWRNRPVDGVLYFPGRSSWAELAQLPPRRSGDLLVYSIPPYPTGGSNSSLVAGSYDAAITAWAGTLCRAGWNTPLTAIRLGWENNGDWYPWSWSHGGLDPWVGAFRRFVRLCRLAGLTEVRWTWTLNKGPSRYNTGYSWTAGYPGDAFVDIIGIDPYDMWTPSFTTAQWTANTTNKNPGLNDIAAFARSHGKQVSVDEWGVVHQSGGGYDNPFYVRQMCAWLQANASVVAWESTYDFGASILTTGRSPLAAAQYRKPYPSGWGRVS